MPNAQSLYVQVEVGLPHSKLIDRARVKLGVSTNEAIGLLVRLWINVLERHTGGSLADRSASWIEESVGWRGEPGLFAAFIHDHHLDPDGRVREWNEKYGALEAKREQERVKKQRQRASVPGTVPGTREGPSRDMPNASASSEPRIPNLQVVGRSRDDESVPGTVPGTSGGPLITSTTAVAVSSSVPAIPKTELVGREHALGRSMVDQCDEFGEFSEDVQAVLRGSRNPRAVIATLKMQVQEGTPPLVVGRAIRDMAANGEEFNAARFRGFLRSLQRAAAPAPAAAPNVPDAEAMLAQARDWAASKGGYKHITADDYKRDIDPAVRRALSACGGLKMFETADEVGLRILTKKFVQVYTQETANASA